MGRATYNQQVQIIVTMVERTPKPDIHPLRKDCPTASIVILVSETASGHLQKL